MLLRVEEDFRRGRTKTHKATTRELLLWKA